VQKCLDGAQIKFSTRLYVKEASINFIEFYEYLLLLRCCDYEYLQRFCLAGGITILGSNYIKYIRRDTHL
jgi:hypothetical protein